MPANSIYVGRGSKWGNPFSVKRFGREKALQLYREYVLPNIPIKELEELREKNLVCWCKEDEACHADILMKLANKDNLEE